MLVRGDVVRHLVQILESGFVRTHYVVVVHVSILFLAQIYQTLALR